MAVPRRAAPSSPDDHLVVSYRPARRQVTSPAVRVFRIALVAALLVAVGVVEGAALRGLGVTESAAPAAASVEMRSSRSYDRASLAPEIVASAAAQQQPRQALFANVEPSPKPISTLLPTAPSEAEVAITPPADAAAIDYQEAGAEAGIRYATATLNLRLGPSTDFSKADTVATATKLTITEWEVDGWRQILYDDQVLWASQKYLSETKPKPPAAQGLGSVEPCRKVTGIEGGITNRMTRVARQMCHLFPGISSFGGYRNQGGSLHSSGRAVDAMISGEAGWEVARWARAHARELGIVEILYSQKIWTAQRASEGWRSFSDRGSATANHYDHVHVGVRSG